MVASMKLLLSALFCVFLKAACSSNNLSSNGYIIYCPCMGRFGNQADHFLGSLAFAKSLNRTLVLPPWVEYKFGESKSRQIPFNTYFKVEPLLKYHDVILMEDFMKTKAGTVWPPENRIAFCYMARGNNESCNAKEGNPFGPFWDTFSIEFSSSEFYGPFHYDIHHSDMSTKWNEKYPAEKWPVLAFTGAPATFPVQKENKELQKYLEWSDEINALANKFIKENLPPGGVIGIHFRNGIDWVRTCEHIPQSPILFASPQCFGYRSEYGPVTAESCFPSKDTVIQQIRRVLRSIKNVASIFVASDSNHMLEELRGTFKHLTVEKYPENNPHVDLAILGRANYFIGNCVSSFSAFVKRERDAKGFPSSFWAFPPKISTSFHDEL